jgi:hypothetical protein
VYASGLAILVGMLGKNDPSWLDGLNTKTLEFKDPQNRKRLSSEAVEVVFGEGKGRLTDAQWEGVKNLIDPRVLNSKSGIRPFGARTMFDGILMKLRTGVGFRNMPPEFGKTTDLLGAMKAMVRTGS